MWTPQDFDLVETLTRRVRILSTEQIARIPWQAMCGTHRYGLPKSPRLQKLFDDGFLARAVINVRPLMAESPLFSWCVGEAEPDAEQLAAQISARWPIATKPLEVCWATRQAASLFGSSAGRLPKLHHRDHDLLLADAYVHYRMHEPKLASRWRGEDSLSKAGYRIKDPDAFLVDERGQIIRVIESSGCYSTRQISAFHDHCASEGFAYELW